MNRTISRVAAVSIGVAAIVLALGVGQAVLAQNAGGGAGGGARYTVVMTEGHNLIVTDNQANTLYFYTIDREKEIGSELKLRGSVDLNQVGKPEIKPTTHAVPK